MHTSSTLKTFHFRKALNFSMILKIDFEDFTGKSFKLLKVLYFQNLIILNFNITVIYSMTQPNVDLSLFYLFKKKVENRSSFLVDILTPYLTLCYDTYPKRFELINFFKFHLYLIIKNTSIAKILLKFIFKYFC